MSAGDSTTMCHVPLLVLTLARSEARQKIFAEHARDVGLVFDFVYGVDAREVPIDRLTGAIDQKALLSNMGRLLSPGEIACAISHREIFLQVIARGWAGALILEDDVLTEPGIQEFIADIRVAASAGNIQNEVIYLGGRQGFEEARIALSMRSRLRWKTKLKIRRIIRTEHAIQRTCGYFISRRACEELLEREPKVVNVADAWEARIRNGTFGSLWMTLPPIVQHPLDLRGSLIEKERLALEHEARARLHWSLPHTNAWRACVRLIRRTIYFPLLRIIG